MSSYSDLEEPDRADHLWRYTPWHRIHPTGNHQDIPDASGPIMTLSSVDGSTDPAGVSLHAATEDDILRLAVNGDQDVSTQFIRELCASNVVVLKIEAKSVPSQPIILEIEPVGDICALHLLLDIGEQCELEMLTRIVGDADWFGFLRQGSIGKASHVADIVVNQMGQGHLLRTDGLHLGRDSVVKCGAVASGSNRCKADLRYTMDETGASLKVNGSILSTDKMHNDHHVEILHVAPQTFSRLDWHSACAGESRTVGTGMLRIDHGAKGADAGQIFHNLLLSDQAEADSIPELEVSENDVVGCGHGTANGPIDEEQLFYLKTRGFSENQGREILISAFLNATLTDMGSEIVHNYLLKILNKDLSHIA
ncbi:MAG: SufD family Fe-S cluster assembly protein [Candidatus Thalassarchaeaceae archaeon]|jgi:Fe-S cluster assembly protein SufD|nr:SufD family Fe-S cluster assembly protein [Candidatus Thalassarchaeaceae archaeon]